MVGVVSDLWRYPVASMSGERLRRVFVGPLGLVGDRQCAVVDTATGEPLVAVREPALLRYRARCDDPGTGSGVQVDAPSGASLPWSDVGLADEVRRDLGRDDDEPVSIVRSPQGMHAAQPVALLTEETIRRVSEWAGGEVDRRRLRPNLVVDSGDDVAFPEDDWRGLRLRIGSAAEIEVVAATRRSGVLSRDPDTAERDTRAHAAVARERRNHVGACCRVVRAGWVAVGDPVRVMT